MTEPRSAVELDEFYDLEDDRVLGYEREKSRFFWILGGGDLLPLANPFRGCALCARSPLISLERALYLARFSPPPPSSDVEAAKAARNENTTGPDKSATAGGKGSIGGCPKNMTLAKWKRT